MKQVVQDYDTGALRVGEVPVPICRAGGVLVRAVHSLVSAGTERMKVRQARMNLVQMARSRPDKVAQVVQNVKQTGLMETYRKVRERLGALTPLGYSLAGVVEEVGGGVDEFQIGDRVACAGEGTACHAEFVFVPRNLCVPLPDDVDSKDAAFTTVGAIATNGVRQAGVTLGDTVMVVGLGLVGLLAVQILKAAGCRVFGVDVDPHQVDLARLCGADAAMTREDDALKETILHLTHGRGPDAAYIAASTQSTDPLQLAGELVRDRGTVVIVGMVKVEANWQAYYNKELSIVMSRSYGPGRYDRTYEEKGIDYPVGYVRWTERRNMEEFVHLLSSGQVRPSLLSSAVVKIDDAPDAYQELYDGSGRRAPGILFEYSPDAARRRRVQLPTSAAPTKPKSGRVGIGLIGAGNFATGTLIPAMKRIPNVDLRGICSARGLSAVSAGQRHGFAFCASDYKELLSDNSIDAVVIATRHDTHAKLATEALRAGKHVFVEKPLALDREQLDDLVDAQRDTGLIVMPGFNRRFSPLSVSVRDFFQIESGAIEVICRVNAGHLGAESWYQDAQQGGWRIVSEGCHWVDLIQYICGAQPRQAYAEIIGGDVAGNQNDNCAVTLRMADGSMGVLLYLANGDPHFAKERIEVFGRGRTAVIENWRAASLHDGGKPRRIRATGSGKGHHEEMAAFVRAIASGDASPIGFEHAVATTLATFAIRDSIASGRREAVGEE